MDRLNTLSYTRHYCDLRDTERYARQALALASDYDDGHAEALNNLAFVCTQRMCYDEAQRLLDSVPLLTDNQVELLVASVQQMRLCQRRSLSREFYDHREQALQQLRRINEERSALTPRLRRRMVYAESELAIVTSTYYYYMGLERQSVQAINDITPEVETDTAQFLAYLYNIGAGGIIIEGTQEDINQQEFDYLLRCLLLSQQTGSNFFEANALEALAEHLTNPVYRRQLVADNLPAVKFVNPDDVAPDDLPLWLASRALHLFQLYGDTYQTAGACRTMASCYVARGDYASALHFLQQALSDSIIQQAPDLVASIHEQLSVAYAALDDKAHSDESRNIYLSLQERTRQDQALQSRASMLDDSVGRLHLLLMALMGAQLVLVALLLLFYLHYRRTRHTRRSDADLDERDDELQEQLALARLHVADGERIALEQRAKVSLVNSITPFIDRLLYAIDRLGRTTATQASDAQTDYIRELTDKINEQNGVLTNWIQLRQGQLHLHVETFRLQELFDLVAKGRMAFRMKGVTLDVEPTAASVKADRVLTLFMLNTLADNARKYTPQGGRVTIRATEAADYVELSVSDTGIGMDEQQLAHVFDHKVITDSAPPRPASVPSSPSVCSPAPSARTQPSHGFGLLNCKGIIEKYRKTSSLFRVCLLGAESEPGQGSRFFFRLPRGVMRTLLVLTLAAGLPLTGAAATAPADGPARTDVAATLTRASSYSDSVLFSNMSAMADSLDAATRHSRYAHSVELADSCLKYLNQFYREQRPDGPDTLMLLGDLSAFPADVRWYDESLPLNFAIILQLRNETAVAALALHEWPLYSYNNRIYTLLYREQSADRSLDDYCRRMQQTQANTQIAIILLVVLLLAIIAAAGWLIMRQLDRASRRRQERLTLIEQTGDELRRLRQEEDRLHVSNAVLDNTLSTLKHETMYYPSRIRQLLDAGDRTTMDEVARYYRELYAILSEQSSHMARHHLQPRTLPLAAVAAPLLAASPAASSPAPPTVLTAATVLGSEELLTYLFDIVARQAGPGATLSVDAPRHAADPYLVVRVDMPGVRRTDDLFVPSVPNIPYLLCRQIVRETGEATGRRDCGIRSESSDGHAAVVITLPRASAPTPRNPETPK